MFLREGRRGRGLFCTWPHPRLHLSPLNRIHRLCGMLKIMPVRTGLNFRTYQMDAPSK